MTWITQGRQVFNDSGAALIFDKKKICCSPSAVLTVLKIANSLEKSFPKNRDYIFWNISAMFLFSVSIQAQK